MKRKLLIFLFLLSAGIHTNAQHVVMSAGNTPNMFIKSGTLFSADSLVLTPSVNLTIATNVLTESPVPLPGVPTSSIKRVYYWNNVVTFTGTIQIYYQLSELNGNLESSLLYYDSTLGGLWNASVTSTVNTTSHFVQQIAAARPFTGATASSIGTVLPLTLIYFTGFRDNDLANLNWMVDGNEFLEKFELEISPDGKAWNNIAAINGNHLPGQQQYHYSGKLNLVESYYRVRITGQSGKISYSPIVLISDQSSTDNIRMQATNGNLLIVFDGESPKGIRLLNAAGQLFYLDATGKKQYNVKRLSHGVYILQYEINQIVKARKFVF